MDRKLKTWEIALMFGVLIAVVAGSWLGREQRELADSVIRFHVIANSDSEADQALKLAVRDRVLARAEEMYPEGATLAQAQEALEGHLNLRAAAGRESFRGLPALDVTTREGAAALTALVEKEAGEAPL